MNKTVLITGIAGSGGSYLAEYIHKNHPEYSINGLVRWHSTTSQKNLNSLRNEITLWECDMMDLPCLIRILRLVRPDKIFNMASHANVRVAFDTPIAVLNNNVGLTANLLEAIRLECPETVLVHCSTSEVYGNPLKFPMKEDHPMKPVNPYAVSKLTQEALAYAYYKSWNLRVVITRAFAYINPRRRELFSTAFANQIARIEEGEQTYLEHGNLDSIRTLVDVRDIAEAYWIASERCSYGEPYNIGGKTPISVKEFLDYLIINSKTKIEVRQSKDLMRPVDVTKQIPDVKLFEDHTQWTPKYSMEESVQWLLDYCRKEQK